MSKAALYSLAFWLITLNVISQKVNFEEYDLDNGLHVILYQDNSKPRVHVNIMYHVGSKDDDPNRTGFAHFFEHLLFEGTKNIEKGEWDDHVKAYGGFSNANTSEDRTFYINHYPPNALEIPIWMESERLLHPVITEIGVEEQRQIVKEEKKLYVDNSVSENLKMAVRKNLFKKYPYHISVIGSTAHLNSSTLDEFIAYKKKFYVPNNAALVIAGNFEASYAKKLVQDYFGSIPRGEDIVRNYPKEDPITKTKTVTLYNQNITNPHYAIAYITPGSNTRESIAINLINQHLLSPNIGIFKKLINDKKITTDFRSLSVSLEAYGIFGFYFVPNEGKAFEDILSLIDEELYKLQNELISEKDFHLLQAQVLNPYKTKLSLEDTASNLTTSYLLKGGNTNHINEIEDAILTITREDIQNVAKKYLSNNQRLELKYLPENN